MSKLSYIVHFHFKKSPGQVKKALVALDGMFLRYICFRKDSDDYEHFVIVKGISNTNDVDLELAKHGVYAETSLYRLGGKVPKELIKIAKKH